MSVFLYMKSFKRELKKRLKMTKEKAKTHKAFSRRKKKKKKKKISKTFIFFNFSLTPSLLVHPQATYPPHTSPIPVSILCWIDPVPVSPSILIPAHHSPSFFVFFTHHIPLFPSLPA